jgi:hypothetical protein
MMPLLRPFRSMVRVRSTLPTTITVARLGVALAVLASIAACRSPAESDWERQVGTLPVALSSVQSVMVASPIRAGVPFAVTITTVGSSSCTRGDGVEVERSSARVVLTPYDWVAPRGSTCTRDMQQFPRTVELTLAQPGEYTLRVEGRPLEGNDSGGAVELLVVVDP